MIFGKKAAAGNVHFAQAESVLWRGMKHQVSSALRGAVRRGCDLGAISGGERGGRKPRGWEGGVRNQEIQSLTPCHRTPLPLTNAVQELIYRTHDTCLRSSTSGACFEDGKFYYRVRAGWVGDGRCKAWVDLPNVMPVSHIDVAVVALWQGSYTGEWGRGRAR